MDGTCFVMDVLKDVKTQCRSSCKLTRVANTLRRLVGEFSEKSGSPHWHLHFSVSLVVVVVVV
eukprot:96804-Hanusia_phi.AAC.1